MNRIEIWQPRWKDRTVLIAARKVKTFNVIVFTKTPSLPGEYQMMGEKIRTYPLDTNGKIPCYAVRLEDLVDEVVE